MLSGLNLDCLSGLYPTQVVPVFSDPRLAAALSAGGSMALPREPEGLDWARIILACPGTPGKASENSITSYSSRLRNHEPAHSPSCRCHIH